MRKKLAFSEGVAGGEPGGNLLHEAYSSINACASASPVRVPDLRTAGNRSVYPSSLMPSVTIRPRSPALWPFVESLTYNESNLPMALERILPGGRVEMMVNFEENEFRTYHGASNSVVRGTHGAILSGPHSHSTVIDTREMRCLMNVSFRFGGAWPFFKMPLAEAQDQLVELDQIWGRDGATLRERLVEARTLEMKFQILESALVCHLSHAQALDPLIPFAISAFDRGIPVARVASKLGQLPKSFVRRFRGQTGLSPKRFSRVLRMQRCLRSVAGSREVDWAGLAAEHGFTDQAHMIHEFRELTSLSPTAYRPRSAGEHNHVPLAAVPD